MLLSIPVKKKSKDSEVTRSYLYELSVSLINLAENAGSVFHKVLDCIHVVEGH